MPRAPSNPFTAAKMIQMPLDRLRALIAVTEGDLRRAQERTITDAKNPFNAQDVVVLGERLARCNEVLAARLGTAENPQPRGASLGAVNEVRKKLAAVRAIAPTLHQRFIGHYGVLRQVLAARTQAMEAEMGGDVLAACNEVSEYIAPMRVMLDDVEREMHEALRALVPAPVLGEDYE